MIRPALAVLLLVAGLLFTAGPCDAQQAPAFRPALPGYAFEFPRDHFAHPDFRTEWWYYTGNLTSDAGKTLGFELTFFREGVANPHPNPSRWRITSLYFAHFAVTDVSANDFLYDERMNRGALGLAGVTEYQPGGSEARIWVGDWSTRIAGGGHTLSAEAESIGLQLELRPLKVPVVHGAGGISRKGPEWGNASHYYSLTRLAARGQVRFRSRLYKVSGLAWMDHEFSSSMLSAGQAGWDWFSLQLDDGSELMFYQIRRADGSPDVYSAGTLVPFSGGATTLTARDFVLKPNPRAFWRSARTGARYPLEWTLEVPSLELELSISAAVSEQELRTSRSTGVNYWEGSVRAVGKKGGTNVMLRGYLEMTGYDRALGKTR